MVSMATHSEFEKGAQLLLILLLITTKLNTKVKLRHMPITHLLHMQII